MEDNYFNGGYVEMSDRDVCIGDIPFMIELYEGHTAEVLVQFVNATVPFKYCYKCILPTGRVFCFRTAADARMAAKGNDWRYVGK